MTKILDELLAANKSYAEKFGRKGDLQAAPIKKICNTYLYGCKT